MLYRCKWCKRKRVEWNVISLETGNKIFDFQSNSFLRSFEVGGQVYIVTSLLENENENLLYNSNETLMFNGEKLLISNIYGRHFAKAGSKWMITLSNNNSDGYYNGIQFAIYEDGKMMKKSKKYDSTLSMNDYEGKLFAVVLDGEEVNLIDVDEKIITNFVSVKDKKLRRSSLLQVKNGIFSLQLEFVVGNGTVDRKYTYDYKNSMTLNKTCPNDSKVDITSCITNGKSEEECILMHCPCAGKVENPKTGIYVTTLFILSCITAIVLFILKGKNYLKRM